MKITKRDRKLIRGQGGRFASVKQIAAVKRAKKKHPEKTYKQLSAAWIKRNKQQYPERFREPATGQLLSRSEEKEIKEAAKYLNIPVTQATALYVQDKIRKSELGNTPLHTVSGMIDTYGERVKDYTVKIKLPGEKRYRVFKDLKRARKVIEQIKADIFAAIRAQSGKSVISSDEIPVIPIFEKFKAGQFLPIETKLDFSKVQQLHELDEEEYEEIIENLKSGHYATTAKNEGKNDTSDRTEKPRKSTKKTKRKR